MVAAAIVAVVVVVMCGHCQIIHVMGAVSRQRGGGVRLEGAAAGGWISHSRRGRRGSRAAARDGACGRGAGKRGDGTAGGGKMEAAAMVAAVVVVAACARVCVLWWWVGGWGGGVGRRRRRRQRGGTEAAAERRVDLRGVSVARCGWTRQQTRAGGAWALVARGAPFEPAFAARLSMSTSGLSDHSACACAGHTHG